MKPNENDPSLRDHLERAYQILRRTDTAWENEEESAQDEHAELILETQQVISDLARVLSEHQDAASPALQRIYIVRAEHAYIGGVVERVFSTQEAADIEAADCVNMMMPSEDLTPDATPSTWMDALERLNCARCACMEVDREFAHADDLYQVDTKEMSVES